MADGPTLSDLLQGRGRASPYVAPTEGDVSAADRQREVIARALGVDPNLPWYSRLGQGVMNNLTPLLGALGPGRGATRTLAHYGTDGQRRNASQLWRDIYRPTEPAPPATVTMGGVEMPLITSEAQLLEALGMGAQRSGAGAARPSNVITLDELRNMTPGYRPLSPQNRRLWDTATPPPRNQMHGLAPAAGAGGLAAYLQGIQNGPT